MRHSYLSKSFRYYNNKIDLDVQTSEWDAVGSRVANSSIYLLLHIRRTQSHRIAVKALPEFAAIASCIVEHNAKPDVSVALCALQLFHIAASVNIEYGYVYKATPNSAQFPALLGEPNDEALRTHNASTPYVQHTERTIRCTNSFNWSGSHTSGQQRTDLLCASHIVISSIIDTECFVATIFVSSINSIGWNN